jgi:hypothetical protein
VIKLLSTLAVALAVTAVPTTASAAPPRTTASNEYGVTAASPCTTQLTVTSSPYALNYEVWSEGRLLATGFAGPGVTGVHTLAVRRGQPMLVYSNQWGTVWLQLVASARPCHAPRTTVSGHGVRVTSLCTSTLEVASLDGQRFDYQVVSGSRVLVPVSWVGLEVLRSWHYLTGVHRWDPLTVLGADGTRLTVLASPRKCPGGPS